MDLDYWLSVVTGKVPQPADDFIVIAFPTDTIRDEYLGGISGRPESEVRKILANMLGHSRSIPDWDALQLQLMKAMLRRYTSVRSGRRFARFSASVQRLSEAGDPVRWRQVQRANVAWTHMGS